MVFNLPTLTVTPQERAHVGTFAVNLTQVRSSDGITTTYQAATVTIGCIVRRLVPPNVPTLADRTYTIFDETKEI